MFTVAALYHFTRFPDPGALRAPLLACAEAGGVKGTLLLAPEGINGTIAGPRAGIDAVLAHIRALPGCAALIHKESPALDMPFGRMKVRLKREIVTMGQPDVDPRAAVGHYVDPADWNALIAAPDVAVGLTSCDFATFDWEPVAKDRRRELAALADFDRVGGSFISHDHHDLGNPAVAALAARGVPILCWTIRSEQAERAARRVASNITYEGYTP